MLYVYDLDGTLIDSKIAVEESYKAAGVSPPPDFWGKPFSAWSGDWRAHEMKNELYPEMLKKYGARKFCADLMATTEGYILTGASYDAALYAIQFLGLSDATLGIYDECDDARKLRKLEELGEGIYFDDDFRFCQRVKELTTWQAIHVL